MNRIKELRERKKIKQVELARFLNVSQGTLSNWERGVHDVENGVLIKLSNYFQVSIDYLLGRPGTPTSDKSMEETVTPSEKRMLLLARKADNLSETERETLLKHFEDSIDMYLSAKGIRLDVDE